MSCDIMLVKTSDGALRPATQDDMDAVAALPLGKPLGATVKTLRNGAFHRKAMALLQFMYERLPHATAIMDGVAVEQSFNRFRQEAVMICGFYHTEVTGKGELRAVAQSLKYSECSQELIEQIYDRLLDLAFAKLDDFDSRDSIDSLINQLVDFQ